VSGPLPTFLLVGAMKSGTTSLIRYLGGHPDVFTLDREVSFFDRWWDRGVDWYRSQFAGAGGEAAVGESSPGYLYLPEPGPRMAQVVPDAQLVAILRDPVDRAYSHYWHNRTRGHEELPFLDALDAEAEREGPAPRRLRYAYAGAGRYAEQLERLAERYPREAIEVVLFEDLRADPAAVLAGVFRFLGVDDAVVPEGIHQAENRFVTYRSMRLRRPIRRLPGPLRRVAGRLNVRYSSYPSLSAEDRASVAARFEKDNLALAEWLGRPPPWMS
jgi:Sulfotransferase domain